MLRHSAACFILCIITWMAGCADQTANSPQQSSDSMATTVADSSSGTNGGSTASFTHVIANEVQYYTTGPQQGRPPDGAFASGTKVNIVRKAGSYALVKSEGGVEAYVAADAVKKYE